MRLVVLGPPGAGKGTQARNLSKYYKTPHISTGDILRAQIEMQTEIGEEIKHDMKVGNLVKDEIVLRLIMKNIAAGDFVLDGYPRTLCQAEILDYLTGVMGIKLDRVVAVDVSDDVIIERMSGRVSCSRCGEVFHLHYHPPKIRDKCNVCGGGLVQRPDDKATTVRNRLDIYHKTTSPIIEFYKKKDLVLSVSGIGEIGEITQQMIGELGDKSKWR